MILLNAQLDAGVTNAVFTRETFTWGTLTFLLYCVTFSHYCENAFTRINVSRVNTAWNTSQVMEKVITSRSWIIIYLHFVNTFWKISMRTSFHCVSHKRITTTLEKQGDRGSYKLAVLYRFVFIVFLEKSGSSEFAVFSLGLPIVLGKCYYVTFICGECCWPLQSKTFLGLQFECAPKNISNLQPNTGQSPIRSPHTSLTNATQKWNNKNVPQWNALILKIENYR